MLPGPEGREILFRPTPVFSPASAEDEEKRRLRDRETRRGAFQAPENGG
jgi:hypothetical protein